jgi:hypothetical protein
MTNQDEAKTAEAREGQPCKPDCTCGPDCRCGDACVCTPAVNCIAD